MISATKTTLLTLAAAIGLATAPANAGQTERKATIDANQAVQAQRIEQERLKGELTRREYRDLKGEQARIAELERKAQADGNVSKKEYNEIHEAQLKAYKHIKDESTDKQGSPVRRWLYRHPGN
jgi:Skp family chaperone for outer membrane proteins